MRSLASCGGPFTERLSCGALLAIFRTPEALPGKVDGECSPAGPPPLINQVVAMMAQTPSHLHLLLNHPRKTRTMLSWA